MRKTWLVLPLALAACGGEASDEAPGRVQQRLAEEGPWHIPADTLAIGDTQDVEYTGAGPWVGESGCAGGMTPGNAILRDYLYTYFPQTYHIGGYACRQNTGNTSQMSVHGSGRALDIMLPLDEGDADNGLGDPIGNWLIENAEAIGIQYIIWDRYTWGAHRDPGEKGRDYGGPSPHIDHLHVELSLEMSENTELWFGDLVDPPVLEGCNPLPVEGGIIEETDACFRAFGPSEYWRVEEAGSGGSLLWTNAFENDKPSNWARWNVTVEESGPYTIEIYVDPDWGVHRNTRYRITHPSGEEIFHVDQSVEQGWITLAELELSSDKTAWVDVFDDVPEPVEDDQRIAVDAVRVTGRGFDPPESEPTPEEPEPVTPGADPELTVTVTGEASCGMSPAPLQSGGWAWLAVAVAAMAARRRRD